MDVKKKNVKFVNEDASEEDAYKEEYNPFYHCAHCNYKTNFRVDLKEHMYLWGHFGA